MVEWRIESSGALIPIVEWSIESIGVLIPIVEYRIELSFLHLTVGNIKTHYSLLITWCRQLP